MLCALRSTLRIVPPNKYASYAVLTAVAFDHALTFSKEVEHIWRERWTWVTFMFTLVRYVGPYGHIIPQIVDGITQLDHVNAKFTGKIEFMIRGWAFVLFLGAADFVMILRVWSSYNRSELILVALLTLFSLEIVPTVLFYALSNVPSKQSVTFTNAHHSSPCILDLDVSPIWLQACIILRITHSTVMCILLVVKFMKRTFGMYRTTRQWKVDRYLTLLAKQGVLYFFAFLFSFLVNAVIFFGGCQTGGWQTIALIILEYVPMFIVVPRFIMSIRELYAKDDRRGGWIDSGFGLAPASSGSIVFADVEQDESIEMTPKSGTGASARN